MFHASIGKFVQSREVMGCLFGPALDDVFEWRLQPLGEIIGIDEGLQMLAELFVAFIKIAFLRS